MPHWFHSFRFRLVLLFGGLSLAIGLGTILYLEQLTTDYLTRERGAAHSELARAMAVQLDANLHERTREIGLLAQSPMLVRGPLETPELRALLERIQQSHRYYAWIGVADPNGRILSSVNGLLAGADAGQRPWFLAGRSRPYVGDVHEAVMLAKLLPAQASGDPLRVLDFSAPVFDEQGNLRGVLAAHSHWNWVGSILQAMLPRQAAADEVEVYVLNRRNAILHPFAASGTEAVPAGLPDDAGYAELKWGARGDFLTAVAVLAGPSSAELGWKIVVRQPVAKALAPVAALRHTLLGLGVLSTLALMALAYLLARHISRPLERLAGFAQRIEGGEEDVSLDLRSRTTELQRLGESLQAMTRTLLQRRDALQQAAVSLERRVAERTAELEAARNRFQAFLLQAPIAMAVEEDGRLLLRNEQFARLFGYGEADLPDAAAWWAQAYPDPDYRAWAEQTWAAAVRQGEAAGRAATPVEYRVRCKDGSVRNVEISGVSLGGVQLSTYFDVTALKGIQRNLETLNAELRLRTREAETASQELERQTRLLGEVVESLPSGLVVYDAERRLVLHNRLFASLLAYPAALVERPGVRFDDFVRFSMERGDHPDQPLASVLPHFIQAMRARVPLVFERRQFDGVSLKIQGTPLADGWTLLTYTDITAHKRAEQGLEEARQLAERASQAKSTFLANMSHEIRTPLNAINGMAHLIRRSGVTPLQAERLDKLDTANQHLLEVINDILDISKIEAGKFVIDEIDVDLGRIVANVASLLAERAREKGLTLHIDSVPPACPLRGDPLRLQQALLNYATNALKFTDAGSVTLRTRLVGGNAHGVQLRFEVEDSGIGIAADTLPRLFQSFEQADDSITRSYGGTGLGLAITRRLAELMGGEAGVRSTPGVGSVFWFTARLKVGEAPGKPASAEAEDPETVLRERHAGARILVVDDEPVNREVARILLEEVGLLADTAADGAEAIALAGQQAYALILMDMQMPRLDGLAATRQLRQASRCAATPVIAMTANTFAEDRERCLAAGMNDFLSKPFAPDKLFAILVSWLGRPPG